MVKIFWLAAFTFLSFGVMSQGFELSAPQENTKGIIGETIKVPIRVKNTSEKYITLVVRKLNSQIGSTQKNFYCLDNNCLDSRVDDFIVRVEAGQTLNTLQIALEAGLVPGESVVKYIAYNKATPSETIEFEVNFVVDEKVEKRSIYISRDITLHDVYPNPAKEQAFVDYTVFNDRIKARVLIHNVLGNLINQYELPFQENKIKIPTQELSAGIYFYTLYVDNKSVMTHKLIVN